jgi:mRNA interferase RelE/StbE
MAYQILIEKSPERFLERLDSTNAHRIRDIILALVDEPRPQQVQKLKGFQNAWRIRKGDYRIVYHIDDDAQEITIARIAHRRDVYRP